MESVFRLTVWLHTRQSISNFGLFFFQLGLIDIIEFLIMESYNVSQNDSTVGEVRSYLKLF